MEMEMEDVKRFIRSAAVDNTLEKMMPEAPCSLSVKFSDDGISVEAEGDLIDITMLLLQAMRKSGQCGVIMAAAETWSKMIEQIDEKLKSLEL